MASVEIDLLALVIYALLLLAIGTAGGALGAWYVLGRRQDEERPETEKFDQLYKIFSDITHSLKTVIDVFRGHLHNLSDKTPSDEEAARVQAEKVRVARTTMFEQVDELEALCERLDLTVRLGLRDMPLKFGPVDVPIELERLMMALEAEATRKSIELLGVSTSQARGGRSSLSISADRAAVRQALSYVLQNTLRHAGEGTQVKATVFRKGAWLHIEISDTGRGMDTTAFVDGRVPGEGGMGMRLCRHLIELHKGEIHIASQPGAGTTVSIKLPAWRLGAFAAEPPVTLRGR